MKGDFTRFTHDPARQYTGVLKQQGRVDLDADANEAVFIQDYLDRTRLRDILCGCAFPQHASGFDVTATVTNGAPDLLLSPGRGYVDGLLCVVPPAETGPTTYLNQPFFPAPPPLQPEDGRRDVVYLDVWQRHVTAIEDPDIREVALGGPDTTTRIQTVWQVKVRPLGPNEADDCGNCRVLPRLADRGRLSVRVEPVPPAEDPCVIGPGAGYRGLENRLYRVEIHDTGEALNAAAPTQLAGTPDAAAATVQLNDAGWRHYPLPWQPGQLVELAGTGAGADTLLARVATVDETTRTLGFTPDDDLNDLLQAGPVTIRRVASFKWSRDNGSVAFIIDNFDAADEITGRRVQRDRVLALDLNDIVEVSGDETDLHGGPGTLAEILDLDHTERRLTLSVDVSRHSGETHPKVRRWDQPAASEDVTMHGGAIVIETGVVYDLEDGIQVVFFEGPFISGDYWVSAARAASSTGQSSLETYEEAPPMGVEHYYCCLAHVTWDVSEDPDGVPVFTFSGKRDCRPTFPCLTNLPDGEGCCIDVRPGDDLRIALAEVLAAGGGRICLCAGVHDVIGPLFLTDIENVTIAGQGTSTVLQLRGSDEAGRGGIIVDRSRRIGLASMVVLGDDVPALVTVTSGAGDAPEAQAQTVTLRDLVLLNPRFSGEGRFNCAVSLADTRDVLMENCRMLAEVGILSRFGPELPVLPESEDEEEIEDIVIGFEDQQPGRTFNTGETFTASGAAVTVVPFQFQDGDTTNGAVVAEASPFGGIWMICRSAGLAFDLEGDFGEPVRDVRLNLFNQELLFNLEINGDLRVFSSFDSINGATIGGTTVSVVTQTGQFTNRRLSIDGPVRTLAIGGMFVRVDEVRFTIGEAAPPDRVPLDYGDGVRSVHLHRVLMRYVEYGICTLRSDEWHLRDSDLRPLDLNVIDEIPPDDPEALRTALDLFADTEPGPRLGRRGLRGTAIRAFLWRDCTVEQTYLEGARGLDAWWCVRGAVDGCNVHASRAGLHTFWLHDADWRDNRVACFDGPAFAFVGSYRARITGNRVTAVQGVLRTPLQEAVLTFYECLREVVRAYGVPTDEEQARLALWMLLEEGARQLRLTRLVEVLQDILDAYAETPEGDEQFDGPPPPVLYLAATFLYAALQRYAEQPLEPPFWARLDPLLPVLALTVSRNDVTAEVDGVLLEQFVTFGGLRVAENRIHAENGQTIRIDAWPYAANVSLVIFALRTLFVRLDALLAGTEPGDQTPFGRLALVLRSLLLAWHRAIEPLFVTDCRIAENTLSSLNTAVESNLFELAIEENHITLRERPLSNTGLVGVIGVLQASDAFAGLGTVSHTGDVATVDYAGYAVRSEAADYELFLGSGSGRARYRYAAPEAAEARAAVDTQAATVTMNWNTFDADVRVDVDAYQAAVAAGDLQRARDAYVAVTKRVLEALNSYGIWAKGAGCRITGNHVLAPEDVDPDTLARGGIRLQGDERVNLIILLLGLLSQYVPGLDPLLGVTETVVDDNEVIGGIGHGIDVMEAAGGRSGTGDTDDDTPSILSLQALFDLKVRGNQIRGMGGAGLSIDPNTLAVNVDVEHNRITLCSREPAVAAHTLYKGGIVITNAALVRLQGNEISRCGGSDADDDVGFRRDVAGVQLGYIAGLTLSDNRILRNGDAVGRVGGGARLFNVVGHADVCDNEFLANATYGLRWGNRLRGDLNSIANPTAVDPSLASFQYLYLLMLLYLRPPYQVDFADVHALVGSNVFRSADAEPGGVTGFEILVPGVRLNLNGNTCYGRGNMPLGVVQSVAAGVVTGNLFDLNTDNVPPLLIDGMGEGVITSNTCTVRAISVLNASGVHHGFNHPPIPGPTPLP